MREHEPACYRTRVASTAPDQSGNGPAPTRRPTTRPGARARLLATFAALAACAGTGCGAPSDGGGERPPSLLLITVDTLRADHLGAWDYGRPTSPRVDALAARSVVFEDAQSTASWTLPALASLMTSLHVSAHGADTWISALGERHTTLAEVLAEAGYTAHGVGTHVFMARKYGLQQGFADYDDDLVTSRLRVSHRAITSPDVTARALAWLDEHGRGDAPFFLWLHYFDPHADYRAHAETVERFGGERDVDRYDGEIAFTDAHLGALLDGLESRGLAGDTVVVLTADHGEEFGDHGGQSHGHTLHREVLHVPLLIQAPGHAPRRVRQTVRATDVMPTVLELLDVPAPPGLDGRSLVPLMRGEALPPARVLAELERPARGEVFDSLQSGRWKLLVDRENGTAALYDVEADRGETTDVAARHPDVVAVMTAELDVLLERARARARRIEAGGPVVLDADERESLRALGYVD